ncbi:MAG: MOSC domain-containing protein [Thermoplasmata archaeon]
MVGLYLKPKTPGERGLPKRSVTEAELLPSGVRGDYNHYRQQEIHGDPDSAVLFFPREITDELRSQGWPIADGDLGENVATRGIPFAEFRTGRTIRMGSVLLRTTRACTPCDVLANLPYVGEERLSEFMRLLVDRRGWYGRVEIAGPVRVGDVISIE